MADEKDEKKENMKKEEAIKKVGMEPKPAAPKAERGVQKGADNASEEKIITINLRKESVRKPYWKRAGISAHILREILKKKTRAANVVIGKDLNERLWIRGIENPEMKLRVKIIIEGDTARAELMK